MVLHNDFLEALGVDSKFLDAIGTASAEFGDELMDQSSEVSAQYTEAAVLSFLTPSYQPLPISCEVEHMLGIPPIPIGISEELRPWYYAVRQQKYKYKLMKLLGFVSPSDNGLTKALEIRKYMTKFNHATHHLNSATVVMCILLGHMKFRLNFLMDYPFLNKQEFENTTIPYINESRRY